MPLLQQLGEKRSLNEARNKLVKSSRFWGKRKDDMVALDDGKSAAIFDDTNLDEAYKRSPRRKLRLTMSSRFWG
uniref:Uncharacterized protein n=1 Tax=Setaria digitata TaxID=48799 RepID=A0A915PL31_9BILA